MVLSSLLLAALLVGFESASGQLIGGNLGNTSRPRISSKNPFVGADGSVSQGDVYNYRLWEMRNNGSDPLSGSSSPLAGSASLQNQTRGRSAGGLPRINAGGGAGQPGGNGRVTFQQQPSLRPSAGGSPLGNFNFAGGLGGRGPGGPTGGAGGAAPGATFTLPALAPIVRPPKLMPAKPKLVAPEDGKAKAKLKSFSSRRRGLMRQIAAKRKMQDQAAVSLLMRKMEALRQEEIAFLRVVGKRVHPKAESSSDAPQTKPGEAKPLPIPLSIPTRRPGTPPIRGN